MGRPERFKIERHGVDEWYILERKERFDDVTNEKEVYHEYVTDVTGEALVFTSAADAKQYARGIR